MDFKSEASFKWLYSQDISKIKDLARTVQASYLWKKENEYREKLLDSKGEGSWNCDLRDTSRAVSALASTGTVYPDIEKWILSRQTGDSWNQNIYDTTYALIALADMGSYNEAGCQWLVGNYGKQWDFPGTNALIITALIKQENVERNNIIDFAEFIEERARWIIAQKETHGAWKTLATSNLVIQALILAGYKDEVSGPINWIMSKMNGNASWGKDNGDINTTALSLITLHEYEK